MSGRTRPGDRCVRPSECRIRPDIKCQIFWPLLAIESVENGEEILLVPPEVGVGSQRERRFGRPFCSRWSTTVEMPPSQILREHRLVAQKKTAHKTPWTKEDVRELKVLSKARTPLPEIAKKMKRTERALRRKAGILGIGLGHRR